MPEARMISIVDDDPYAGDSLQELLESLGYAAQTFRSGDEFIQSGRAAKTTCLISDIQMPGLSGLDLRDRLLAEGHKMSVIFMTAYPEKYRVRALEAGASGFLSKPIREESLIGCLKVALPDPRAEAPGNFGRR